ncbi:MAG: hypothetical protein RIS54_991 [Verrucomicrobiota bacterium]|jgi:hypothetical protein
MADEEPHSLSLRRFSNQVAAAMAVVFAVAGFLANPNLPDHFLIVAMMAGLVWGTLRCVGFGERQWQNTVIIFFILLGQQLLFPIELARPSASWLAFLAFFSVAFLLVLFVVWLKERDEWRAR